MAILLGAATGRSAALDRFLQSGGATLLDIRSDKIVASYRGAVIGRPGSTLKPFVLTALLRRGKLKPDESWPCPLKLTIAGRALNCSHPRVDYPIEPHTAIAYSCNCYVAHMAERFGGGELASDLRAAGFHNLQPAAAGDATKLQALGEDGIAVTADELAHAYARLALHTEAPVLTGLQEAVEFGTAQQAQIAGVKVAGKTGSVRASDGARIAWFAGLMPSQSPEVAIAVMVQGQSGGADAAPVAARILSAYRAGTL